MSPTLILVTLAAGGLAAVLRYALSVALARTSRTENFPWTVLLVNTVGSGLGGLALALAQGAGIPAQLQLIILTGVCGGLTTFSTFSVETIQLITHGRWRPAVLSILLNVIIGLGACTLGYLLGHLISAGVTAS